MPPTPASTAAAPAYRRTDFDHSPFVVFYEVTRACDLVCTHCRACAQPVCDPRELSPAQARALIDQLAGFPKPPLLVLTGGDPLKRPDVYDLVRHGTAAGLEVAMTPSATPLLTAEAVARLREAGLARLAVSLDGADASTHDALRGVPGTFERALEALAAGAALGLPLQVNTTVTRHNLHQIDAMAELLADLRRGPASSGPEAVRLSLWSVFFLIPVGRGQAEQRITPEQYEAVFEKLWQHARRQPYAIKTTEAHHYRRFVLQRGGNPLRPGQKEKREEGRERSAAALVTGADPETRNAKPQTAPGLRAPLGVNDGKGVMFVSHTGEIYPSGFLPLRAGQFPLDWVVRVYQEAALFRALRDADQLKGKCGACEYRHICGGSRARAYALTGDPLESEPDCVYVPPKWTQDGT